MTHDWANTRALLVAGSITAFETFFKAHPIREVRAIGYTWEWGQAQAAFYCVANTEDGPAQGIVNCNHHHEQRLNVVEAYTKVR
jgi:hypothetical protein